jgi:hypothetical protein
MNRALAQTLRQAAQPAKPAPDAPANLPEPTGLRLSLAELIRLHGDASGPVLMMLLAVMATLPIAGAGMVLSLGIFLLSWAWLRGMDNMPLPERLGRVTLNVAWTRRCLHSLAWIYEQADRLLRPRWIAMSNRRLRPLWGVWIALMAAVIFIPLPFGNVLPAISLVLLSLGWMFRDGLALLLAGAAGVGAMVYMVSFSHLVVDLVQRGWAQLPI